MCDFSTFFDKLSYVELLQCKTQLAIHIKRVSEQRRIEAATKNIKDYITEPSPFVDVNSTRYRSLCSELDSLKLQQQSSKSNGVATIWLTQTGQPYQWERANGTFTVKEAFSFDELPTVAEILNELKLDMGIDLNSCLVSFMRDGRCSLRLHDDGEDSLDQSQPIVILIIGEERKVDFLGCYQRSHETPAITLIPESGSVYSMLPGCQEWFKHRILADRKCLKPRFSLSFRCMKLDSQTGSTEVPGQEQQSVATSVATASAASTSEATKIPVLPPVPTLPVSSSTTPPGVNGNSAVPQWSQSFVSNPPKHDPPSRPDRKRWDSRGTTVLFGTSITANVVGRRLGHKGRNVINISESGATVDTISDMVDNFKHFDADADYVDKVVLCFGTNDIKNAWKGVDHLKLAVLDLVRKVKRYFPGATVLVFNVLPMRNRHWFTVRNVLMFNDILQEVCYRTNSYYVDCFDNFLTDDKVDYNHSLFRDDVHLNRRGIGVLCSILKNIINNDVFSSILRCQYGYF